MDRSAQNKKGQRAIGGGRRWPTAAHACMWKHVLGDECGNKQRIDNRQQDDDLKLSYYCG
jgi:hypothetical protein